MFSAWLLLRKVVKHYCVVDPDPTVEKNRDAYKALVDFSKLMHTFVITSCPRRPVLLPSSILSFNLHILVCRLYDQELARGAVGLENEMWVERLIHVLKEVTRYRCSSEPERTAVNTMLIDRALHGMHLQYPDLKTIKELRDADWIASNSSDKLPPDDDGSYFIGNAVQRRQVSQHLDREMVDIFLALHEKSEVTPTYSRDHVDMSNIKVFARAFKRTDEVLHSKLYDGQKSRVNYAVLLRFDNDEVGDTDIKYLGCIDRFIRFTASTPDGVLHVVRIAVLKLWKSVSDQYDGDLSFVNTSQHWVHDGTECPIPQSGTCLYPVLFDRLDCKVCLARSEGRTYILKPHVTSRRM